VKRPLAIWLLALLASLLTVAGAAGAVAGSISGRVYLEDGQPSTGLLLLVVRADRGTTLDLSEFAPGGAPLRTDLVTSHSRDNEGLVRTGPSGEYRVGGLDDGDYLVILGPPSLQNRDFKTMPPIDVTLTGPGITPTHHKAFLVSITGGRAVTDVDFVLAIPAFDPRTGATTGSLEVTVYTYDPTTLAAIPDRILAIEVDPAPAGINVQIRADGALVERIPQGLYVVRVTTATRSFESEVFVLAGTTGALTQALVPPKTGSGGVLDHSRSERSLASYLTALGVAALLAAGVWTLALRQRHQGR
jgi:hypothetical protein